MMDMHNLCVFMCYNQLRMPRKANMNFMKRITILDKLFKTGGPYSMNELVEIIEAKIEEELEEKYGSSKGKNNKGKGIDMEKEKSIKSTLEKDIKSMRKDFGAPIPLRKYCYTNKDFSIFGGQLNDDEKYKLNHLSNFLNELPYAKYFGVKELVEKILKINNEDLLEETFILPDTNPKYTGNEHLQILFEAAYNRKKVKIHYQSFEKSNPEVFIFNPYVLKEHRSRWYIVGYMEQTIQGNTGKNTLIRTLGLERISQVKLVELINQKYELRDNIDNAESFKMIKDFDRKKFGCHSYGVTYTHGKDPTIITLWLSKLQTKYALTMPIHSTQHLKKNKDGSSVVTIEIYPGYEFYHDLKGWGHNMKVLGPKEVKDEALRLLKQALEEWEKS